MRMIFQKLHSRRGASMLISLLFFMVCLTVGSLILGGASASAAKSEGRNADQQNYLAVASAARLLRDELGKSAHVVGRTRSPDVTDPDTGEVTFGTWSPFLLESDADADLLTGVYNEVYNTDASYSGTLTVTAGGGLPAVNATLSMKKTGDVAVVLTAGDYTMTVTFRARTAQNTDGETYDYRTTSWSAGVIKKGAGA